MSTRQESETLARAWIDGWINGTPDEIPLAPDFVHTSPYGVLQGRDHYLETIKPMAAENVNELTVIKTLGGEGEAAIWFEMKTPNGVVQVVDWVKTENNQIKSITSFYDPHVLREGNDSFGYGEE